MKTVKCAFLAFAVAVAILAVPAVQSNAAIQKTTVADIGGPGPLADIGGPGPLADIGGPGPLAATGNLNA